MSEAESGVGAVIAAVSAARARIGKIAFDRRNPQGSYEYASYDAIVAAIAPALAAEGLMIIANEISCEEIERQGQRGTSVWLRFEWEFTLAHRSGASLPPSRRSVEVVRSGPQSYGSAQSYALKHFMRSVFLLSTGDPDGDDHAPAADAGPARATTAPASEPPKMTADEALEALLKGLERAQTMDDLRDFWSRTGARLAKRFTESGLDGHLKRLLEAKDARKAAIVAATHAEIAAYEAARERERLAAPEHDDAGEGRSDVSDAIEDAEEIEDAPPPPAGGLRDEDIPF